MGPRYFDLILGAFVAVILLSNLVAAAKVANVGGVIFGASAILFPLSYVIGDVVTEVYGYRYARRLVWAGTGAMVFAAITTSIVLALPPDASWTNQAPYNTVFALSPRIAAASIVAFWSGEFINAFVLAKMKIRTRGRALWTRTIGSTLAGQAVDCVIFFPLAFAGVWRTDVLWTVVLSNYVFKVTWEIICTPLTYQVVRWMKRLESRDHYDIDTNFSPFRGDLGDE